MKVSCVWEHNGADSLLYSDNFIGAYTRGESKEIALSKMEKEIRSYHNWIGEACDDTLDVEIMQEKTSKLNICDADSDVLFEKEKGELTFNEYSCLKALTLQSAKDFLRLYEAIPDKNKSCIASRQTFYGKTPSTAHEMYEHTKSVNAYYFGEIGIDTDNKGDIFECRVRGFELVEKEKDLLKNNIILGSYNEEWTLKKVIRRFIWHDRIHAKAMYRMAVKTFGQNSVSNVFKFEI